MLWTSIDNSDELSQFERSVFWEDATTQEVFIIGRNEPYFPEDISRSGYEHKNVHLLIDAEIENRGHIHIVLIDCESYTSGFIDNLSFNGFVDGLKRVEVGEHDHYIRMRCSRLIYRAVDISAHLDRRPYLAAELAP